MRVPNSIINQYLYWQESQSLKMGQDEHDMKMGASTLLLHWWWHASVHPLHGMAATTVLGDQAVSGSELPVPTNASLPGRLLIAPPSRQHPQQGNSLHTASIASTRIQIAPPNRHVAQVRCITAQDYLQMSDLHTSPRVMPLMNKMVTSVCRVRAPGITQCHQTACGLIHYNTSPHIQSHSAGVFVCVTTPTPPREEQS